MSIEFIVVAVVVVLVIGIVLFAKKNPGVVQADLQKLEDNIKTHFNAATPAVVVVPVANPATNVAPAATLVQSLTGNGTPAAPVPNVTPTPAGGDQGQSMMLNALLGSSTLKKPEAPPVESIDRQHPNAEEFFLGRGSWMQVIGSNSISGTIQPGHYTTETGSGDVLSFTLTYDGQTVSQIGKAFTVDKATSASLSVTGNGTIQLRTLTAGPALPAAFQAAIAHGTSTAPTGTLPPH